MSTPEKKIDESVVTRLEKPPTTSNRKMRRVTISKETVVKNDFSRPSSEIRSPEIEKNESDFKQTGRSLF